MTLMPRYWSWAAKKSFNPGMLLGVGVTMTGGIEDDDVFYGSKKKASKEAEAQPEKKAYGEPVYQPRYNEQVPPARTEPEPVGVTQEQETNIDEEITQARHEKHQAAELHDITKLRQQAAKHSADAAKFYKKYRAEEAAMVKYTENSNKARRTAEKYLQKSKEATAKANDKQTDLEYLQDRKAERARIKIAKLHAKSAKMKSKSSSYLAKAAKLSQKAAAKREKAKTLLEKSKMHEAESIGLTKRADRLSKA